VGNGYQLGPGEDPVHLFFEARIVLGHFVGVADFLSDEIRADGGQDRFKIGDISDDGEIDPASPFRQPIDPPTISPAPSAGINNHPCTMSIPVLRPAIAYIDPMDRSTSRVISTNVMPTVGRMNRFVGPVEVHVMFARFIADLLERGSSLWLSTDIFRLKKIEHAKAINRFRASRAFVNVCSKRHL
jgi:hypothetical protein